MAEKFPNLKKQISQVQNAQSSNRPIWGAIIIKMTKLKEKSQENHSGKKEQNDPTKL